MIVINEKLNKELDQTILLIVLISNSKYKYFVFDSKFV